MFKSTNAFGPDRLRSTTRSTIRSTGRSPLERTDYELSDQLDRQSSNRTSCLPTGQLLSDQSDHRTNLLSKDPHFNRRQSSHQSYLFHRLKPNLISFQACLLFIFLAIFLITVHLSPVAASSEHFSDDLSKPNSGKQVHNSVPNSVHNPVDNSVLDSVRPTARPTDELSDKLTEDRKLNDKTFLNEFAIELDASSCQANRETNCKEHLDKKADEIAAKHGFVNDGQVSSSFLF